MQIKCDHCGAVAETIEPKTARAGELRIEVEMKEAMSA